MSDHNTVCLGYTFGQHTENTTCRLSVGILNNKTTIEQIEKEVRRYIKEHDTEEIISTILWNALKAVKR